MAASLSKARKLTAQPIGVIGLLVEDNGALVQMAERLGSGQTVVRLARHQQQFERQAAGIGQGTDFGAQPATARLFARPKKSRSEPTGHPPAERRAACSAATAQSRLIQNPSAHTRA